MEAILERQPIFNPLPEISIAPNLGEDPDFEDINFDLSLEMRRFFKSRNYWELDSNLRTFTVEFIKGGTVLPHLIRMDGVSLVNNYDGQRILPKISPKERFSANVRATEVAEDFFAQGREDGGEINRKRRMVVINSPHSWNGIGNDYLTAQSIVMWEDENFKLRGVTLVSDLEIDQIKQFSITLGVNKNDLRGDSEKVEISNIVANPALIEIGSGRFNGVEDVVSELLAIRGNKDFELKQHDASIRVVPTANMFRDIKRREQLLDFSEAVEEQLKVLRSFILEREDSLNDFSTQYEISNKVKETIFRITRSIRKEGLEEKVVYQTVPQKIPYGFASFREDNFEEEKRFLRARAGCVGKNRSLSVFTNSLGLDSESVFGEENLIGGFSKESGVCKVCRMNQAVKGGCGYCEGCAHKAA